jgi:hypothetical protein
VVLTDGDTPWPERRPPGVGVVIVVIADDDPSLRTPDWARTIRVDAR